MATRTKTNIITSQSGDRMAVIPLDEYERLLEVVEEASGALSYDKAKRKLKSGEEELIPAEFADRMIDGENKVRVWREYRGMSAKALAEAAGIAPAYLSQMETGAREGTIETVKKIAAALRVSIDDIV